MKKVFTISIFLLSLFFSQQINARKKPTKAVTKSVAKKPVTKQISHKKAISKQNNSSFKDSKSKVKSNTDNNQKNGSDSVITKRDSLLTDTTLTSSKGSNTEKSQNNAGYGVIKGIVYFPDTLNPIDLRVIAVNTETLDTTVSKPIESRKKNTYSLKLKSGKYNVYTYTDMLPNIKAYYTEWVVCKQEPWCRSHKIIEVNVTSGKTLEKINPVDWKDLE